MTSVMSRMRPDENTKPRNGSSGTPAGIALLPIGADLLPRQAAVGRGGRRNRYAAFGIVALALVAIAGAYLFSAHAKSNAESSLASAQDQQLSLQHQQQGFDQLVRTRAQDTQLRSALASVMKTDTNWSNMLVGIAKADTGIDFSSITASLNDPSAPAVAGSAPTTPGAIGTLTMSGQAADKPTVAGFVDALGGVTGLADPFLSSVTATAATQGSAAGYTFTVTVAITGDLQTSPSRWATTTGGGK